MKGLFRSFSSIRGIGRGRSPSSGGGGVPSDNGFFAAPSLSGMFLQGQVVYCNYTVSDPIAVQVEHRVLYNGVVQPGELHNHYLVFAAPAPGDTIVFQARVKSGATWLDWVSSNTLTYTIPADLTTREFGALTLAGAGGFNVPAGATSITNAGGTNLTVTAGRVVPASNGVTSGTVTFNNGATRTITAVPNAYSVSTIQELRTAMQQTGLVRGTHKILCRGGIEYNPARSRIDVSLATGGIGGTIGIAEENHVLIHAHSNEPKPVIVHMGFAGQGRPNELSEFAFQFTDCIFGGQPMTDLEIADANVEKAMVLGRSGTPQSEMVKGLRFLRCYFGVGGTDAPQDWKRRTTAVGDQGVNHFNRFEHCIFDRVSYGLRYPMHAAVIGCQFWRFTRDAMISNSSGNRIEWNEFGRHQTIHEEWVNPPVISNVANALRLDLTGGSFFDLSVQTSREDGRFIIMDGDGDMAAHIGEFGSFVSGSTVQFGTQASMQLDLTDVDFGTVTSWTIRLSSFHGDMVQSTRRDGVVYPRSPVLEVPEYGDADSAFVGNILHHGDWPEYGSLQAYFQENQNGLDAARSFAAGNTIASVFAHGLVVPDQGSIVAIYNTIASAKYPNAVAGISGNNADGGTGMKKPEDILALGNVTHNISFQGAVDGVSINNQCSIVRNTIISFDGSNATSIFVDPRDWSGTVAYHAPLEYSTTAYYRVLPAVGEAGVGALGNPRVSYTTRTIDYEPVAYGGRVLATATAGELIVSGRCLIPGDTVYWLLSNVPGQSYASAQQEILTAVAGGPMPTGGVEVGSVVGGVTSRWTETLTGMTDGAYKLHTFATRSGVPASDSVVIPSPVYIYSTATEPTIENIAVARANVTTTQQQILLPGIPVGLAGTDLYAFVMHRGFGNISYVDLDELRTTNLSTDLTLNTANRYSLRGIVNPADRADVDALIRGNSGTNSGTATVALIEASGANTYFLSGVSGTGITSISATLNVLAGDKVVTMFTNTNGDFGTITLTGLTMQSTSAPMGSSTAHSAIAVADITANNAAYAIGGSWAASRNNVGMVSVILRRV